MSAKFQGSHWSHAVSLVTRTLPFLGVNAAVYGVFFLGSMVWFTFWGGLALLTAKLAPILFWVFLAIGVGVGGGLVKFARRYLLYLVKGAHIAAMTEIMHGGQLPGGMGQFKYGQTVIKERFKDVSILFAVDTLVTASLKALQRKALRITSWLPLPEGAQSVVRAITEILARALTYVDEAILSYAILRREPNIWNSAKEGIVLYAQSYKPILITAAKVWLIGKVAGFLAFLLFLIPAAVVMALASSYVLIQVIALVLALVASWALVATFFEPFALAYTLVTYHASIEGKVPDLEWDRKLLDVSPKYRELTNNAANFQHTPAGEPATVPA